jgi:hypothetical protein
MESEGGHVEYFLQSTGGHNSETAIQKVYFISLYCGIDSHSVGLVLRFSFTLHSDGHAARLRISSLPTLWGLFVRLLGRRMKNGLRQVLCLHMAIQTTNHAFVNTLRTERDSNQHANVGAIQVRTERPLFVNDFGFTAVWKQEIRHCFHFCCRIIHYEGRRKQGDTETECGTPCYLFVVSCAVPVVKV